jgi:hypothetical protein
MKADTRRYRVANVGRATWNRRTFPTGDCGSRPNRSLRKAGVNGRATHLTAVESQTVRVAAMGPGVLTGEWPLSGDEFEERIDATRPTAAERVNATITAASSVQWPLADWPSTGHATTPVAKPKSLRASPASQLGVAPLHKVVDAERQLARFLHETASSPIPEGRLIRTGNQR